jgi:hypothetical protein
MYKFIGKIKQLINLNFRALKVIFLSSFRHAQLSAAQILTHTIWLLADAAECEVRPRSPDEHGACTVTSSSQAELHL